CFGEHCMPQLAVTDLFATAAFRGEYVRPEEKALELATGEGSGILVEDALDQSAPAPARSADVDHLPRRTHDLRTLTLELFDLAYRRAVGRRLRLGFACAWWHPRPSTWSYTATRLHDALAADV